MDVEQHLDLCANCECEILDYPERYVVTLYDYWTGRGDPTPQWRFDDTAVYDGSCDCGVRNAITPNAVVFRGPVLVVSFAPVDIGRE